VIDQTDDGTVADDVAAGLESGELVVPDPLTEEEYEQ